MNNAGTILWSGSDSTGQINFFGTTVINNTGRFSATTDGLVFSVNGFPTTMTVNNTGTFEKTGGGGVTRFINYGTFNNNSGGIINSDTGTLQFVQDLQLNNNSFITGAGVVQKSGGSTGSDEVAVGGLLTVTGNFELNGFLLGNPGATVVSIDNRFRWIGGQIRGTLNIPFGSQFTIEGNNKTFSSATVNNAGTVVWSESATLGRINFGGNLVFNNTGRFKATTDGTVFQGGPFPASMAFNNAGTFEKTGGSGVTRFTDYDTFNANNGGIINVDTGTLLFTQPLIFNNHSFITGAGLVQKAGGSTGADEGVINGQVTVTGNFELNGYLLGNSGATIVSTGNRFRWTGGQIRGVLNIASGSQVNIEGNDKALSNATINNAGTIVWSESAALGRINFGGNIVINNTGRFNATTDGLVFHAAGFPATFSFNNTGISDKTGGSGVTTFTDYQLFNNNSGGIINSDIGTLRFSQYLQLRNNSFITGAGVVQKTGGGPGSDEASVEGLLTVTGNFDLNGALSGEPIATIVSTGNRFRWTGGQIRGVLNIPSGTQLNIEGGDKLLSAATLNNAGTILWSGSDTTGRINLGGANIINNSGRFTALTDGLVFWVTGFPVNMTFNNGGIFEKTGGTGITLFSNYFPFNNLGTISIQHGIVRALGLSIAPTSTIESRIAGTTAGTGFGQLRIDSGVVLDGSLNVTFASGFTPAGGNAFPLVTFGSRSGTFASVNTPIVPGRRSNSNTIIRTPCSQRLGIALRPARPLQRG